jgi:hypothetical protein
VSASLDPARILRPPPPPSRSVLFGGAGNCVSRASVVVWVPFTVDSGSLVLHLWGEFSAHSFEASVFSSFPSFFLCFLNPLQGCFRLGWGCSQNLGFGCLLRFLVGLCRWNLVVE